jgi:cyclic pyranopterin phosphate synthase
MGYCPIASFYPARYNEPMTDSKITHLDADGSARMVDVGDKPETERWAVARGVVVMSPETFAVVRAGNLKKGDIRAVAEIAGVQAAKRTAELIPLCHNIPLSHVEVQVALDEEIPGVEITATTRTIAPTGVEMEALSAVSVAALTVYDMIKAVERSARITDIRLIEKHGGASGDVVLEE